MRENVLSSIRTTYYALTPAERDIADYVLAHSNEVINMSITQLSHKCNVAESSVFRFSRHIQCTGYLDFRQQLLLNTNENRDYQDSQPMDNSELGIQLHALYTSNLSILRQTYHLFDLSKMELAVEQMRKAERIMLIGTSCSLISIMDAFQRFLRVTPKVCYAVETRTQELLASTLSDKDVAIVFSRSGSSPELIELAKNVKSNGTYLITITHCSQSPLHLLSDQCFLCGVGEDLILSNYSQSPMCCITSSVSAYDFLLDALCAIYCKE